jgi:ribosomal protein S3
LKADRESLVSENGTVKGEKLEALANVAKSIIDAESKLDIVEIEKASMDAKVIALESENANIEKMLGEAQDTVKAVESKLGDS